MSTKSWNLWKIGIWFLLPVFVTVSVILPASALFAILLEIFTLTAVLQFVCAVPTAAQQPVCVGSSSGIRPRSPPGL